LNISEKMTPRVILSGLSRMSIANREAKDLVWIELIARGVSL